MRGLHWAGLFAVAMLVVITVGRGTPAEAQPKPWFVDEEALPFTALAGAEAHWGVHAGAGYRIEIPDNWNGDLVMYAHGFRGDTPQLTVSNPSIRNHLIANGYAWAASSYSANGYAPGQGAKDTHKLVQRFRSIGGNPDDVFIMGHSMGGHVTGIAIEQWPRTFAGALPMCGVMGDSELFDYFQDAYLVAETLAHGEAIVPTPEDYDGVATRAALGPNFPADLNDAGEKFKAVIENLTGGERPTFDEGWVGFVGANFLIGQAGTGDGRTNVGTEYQFDSDPALSAEEEAFNELIVRIEGEPQFRHPNGLGGLPGTLADSPRINGTIDIPVVSLHTLGELFVPFHMQQIYAERVAEQGNADLLVQRAIRDTGHCGFTATEQSQAFDDLVNWVDNGVKPAGDDVLDPDAVADPAFGCQFTTGLTFTRATVPPCP